MTRPSRAGQRLVVERSFNASLQDLGRPGHAGIGVPPNGASDQHAARTANVLVANPEGATLVEVTGSAFAVRCESDALIAATGAVGKVLLDGQPHSAWEPLPVWAGCTISLPAPTLGFRSYLAFNGILEAERTLGSVSPDPLLGIGRMLADGDELVLDSGYVAPFGFLPLFRVGAIRIHQPTDGIATIKVTPGPDADRLAGSTTDLEALFQVTPDSNSVGLRLDGPLIPVREGEEILSRGIPVGAVQVPHSGGVIVLMRGRLVTAGYPIVAVATTQSLDALGQLRPGDRLRFELSSIEDAVRTLRHLAADRRALADRVRVALSSRGLGDVLADGQGQSS